MKKIFLLLILFLLTGCMETEKENYSIVIPSEVSMNSDLNKLRNEINSKYEIKVNTDNIIIEKGEKIKIDIQSESNVEYFSEDLNIASIQNEVITAKNIGQTQIIIKNKLDAKVLDIEVIPKKLKQQYKIDVKNIMQEPELPTGCEITSLTIVLNYLGFDVDKCYMADNYLQKGQIGTVDAYTAFIGNPRTSWSYGCYSPVIIESANNFLCDNNSNLRAYDLTGSDFEDLFYEIQENNPIIIWATMSLVEPYDMKTWNINGKNFTWRANLHCMVLTGYDLNKNIVYVSDPLQGNIEYDLEIFKDRYQKMFSQAIVVK